MLKSHAVSGTGTSLPIIVSFLLVKVRVMTIDKRGDLDNFGHTIGRAIEAALTFTILHGKNISAGVILEERKVGILSQVGVCPFN